MKSIAKLKEQARLHEMKEEWEKAVQAYQQVLQASEAGGGELELGLYNRVGDLNLRLGRQAEAVYCYEQAADRYAEAGLYNNAIALCNKALRYLPQQVDLYRKIGQFAARQGFFTDARRGFLEYAERKLKQGERKEALEALEEFADLSDDPEIRELLARQLQASGETREALNQLQKAYVLRVRAGQGEAAGALRAEIRKLDPSADPDALVALETQAGREPEAFGGAVAADSESDPLPTIDLQTAADSAGLDAPRALDAPRGLAEVVPLDLTFAAPAEAAVQPPDPLPLPGLEERTPGAEVEAAPLPLLDAEDAGGLEPPADVEIAPLPELPALDFSLDAGPAEEPLVVEPIMEEPAAGAEEPPDPFAGGRAVEEPPVKPHEPAVKPHEPVNHRDTGSDGLYAIERAHEHLAAGRHTDATAELAQSQHVIVDGGLVQEAVVILSRVVEARPNDLQAHQLRVEYTVRSGARDRLIAAYLDLGACLTRAGAGAKAAVLFQQVLELDPSNKQAWAAVHGRKTAPAREGYVDLAALLRPNEEPAATTRFVVEAQPPSGDEDKDFADLLRQFKAKVNEHLGTEDSASHYDLGLAYKEMGLIDEAIAEFQIALRGEERLKIFEEIGQCFMLKQQYNVAEKILSQALQLPRKDEMDLLGVYYHLGRCYEELGRRGEAQDAYERVVVLDINFRDTSDRLARL